MKTEYKLKFFGDDSGESLKNFIKESAEKAASKTFNKFISSEEEVKPVVAEDVVKIAAELLYTTPTAKTIVTEEKPVVVEEPKKQKTILESKFETLQKSLAEDLREYKQKIIEEVSKTTSKSNPYYTLGDSGSGEVRLLNMDDVETKRMSRDTRASILANNETLTYDTGDKKFHFRYALNQNLLQNSNVIFNNINTTGNINVGGTVFVTNDVTGNTNLNVTGNTSIGKDLLVYGNANTVGNVKIGGTLAVTSDVSDGGNLTVSGNTSIGKNLIVTGNTIIQGNLLVTGNTTTLNVTNLSVKDALIYLNDTSTSTNLDIGITGNYNDGAYKHAGLFRDSNDGVWKFFDGYTPELNVATKILTTDPSYVDAGLKVGNFTANGSLTVTKAVTITGNLSAGNVNTLGVSNVGTSIVTALTASKPVFTDANKALTSSGTMPTNQGGTGLTSFTAKGIVYASSTSALATGSTLQFDGTNFGVGLTPVTNNGVLQLGSYAAIKSLVETATITGAAPSATTNFDWMSQAVQYYTSNTTTNFTLNIRGNGSTSLDTVMQVGQSASIALLVTNSSPAYYMSAINIDGTASGVTVKYINGTSLSSGNANSIDIYNITVIKTASATYTVLVVQTKFA
jgi:hypothetical protein